MPPSRQATRPGAGRLGDLSLGQIVAVLTRYRPVAVSVAVILLALLVLPKPDLRPADAVGARTIETPDLPTSGGFATTVPPTDPGFAVEPFVPGTSVSDAFSPPAIGFGGFASPPPDDSAGSSDGGFGVGSGSSATTSPTTTAPVTPLRVRGSTWATRSAGTPIASQGVPDGTLPVGTRGADDKLSFVRLSGTSTTLGLSEHPDGNRTNSGPVAVAACRITAADWKEGSGVAIADAPPYDATDCVQGVRSDSGVWVFDLGRFSDRTDQRGFALVPGDGAGLDFQVAFRLS